MAAKFDSVLRLTVTALLTVAALGAIGHCIGLLQAFLWQTGWWWTLVAGAVLVVSVITLRRAASSWALHPHRGFAVAFSVAATLRVGLAWAWDAPLVSDFKDYHDLAMGLLDGSEWLQLGRPMGYPLMLAAAYRLFGADLLVGEALGVALGLAGLVGLYILAQRLVGPQGAVWAAWGYALWPANVLMTPVLGTEVPYTSIFLWILVTLVLAGPSARFGWFCTCLAGALTAWGHMVRPTTLALLPAIWAYFVRLTPLRLGGVLRAVVLTAVVLLFLTPVAMFNQRETGRWSYSTSAYGNWSFLVGLNQKHNGMWNVDDAAKADELGDRQAIDAWARSEAWRRFSTDPGATLALVGRKFFIMWASDDYGTYWAYGIHPSANARIVTGLNALSQLFYASVLCLAAFALWRRDDWHPGWWSLWVGLVTLVAVHSLVEVQGRYHAYWTPVFILLAARGLAGSRGGYHS
jgi:hypothetical protein